MSKIVLVTGASRGIGKGIALATSKEGWITYITGRDQNSLQAAVRDIVSQSGKNNVHAVVCDHSKDQQVELLVKTIIDKHGRIDVLVNNAFGAVEELSKYWEQPFWEKPLHLWDSSNTVGLRSNYVASALVSKYMTQRKEGLIVNIGSPGGISYVFDVAYGVGKAGVDRLTADTAEQLKPFNVSVVSLWPGLVATESFLKLSKESPTKANVFNGMETESCEFSGKAVVALAKDPAGTALISGTVVTNVELSKKYGFRDVDGKLPGEAFNQLFRQQMKQPKQWTSPPTSWWIPPAKV